MKLIGLISWIFQIYNYQMEIMNAKSFQPHPTLVITNYGAYIYL